MKNLENLMIAMATFIPTKEAIKELKDALAIYEKDPSEENHLQLVASAALVEMNYKGKNVIKGRNIEQKLSDLHALHAQFSGNEEDEKQEEIIEGEKEILDSNN